MTDWIIVEAQAQVIKREGANEVPPTKDECAAMAGQIAADAVYGTFGEFSSEHWNGKLTANAADFATAEVVQADKSTVRICLKIDSAQYEHSRGGLQHFLGVLAGDLFFLRIPNFEISDFRVTNVQIPEPSVDSLKAQFRKEAYNTERIRAAFDLGVNESLMAFSIKPRVGLKPEALREIVLNVLDAGFHIAEFDTRYLNISNENITFLLRLAKEAAAIGGERRVTRLSPNLSISSPMAVDIYKQFQTTSKWPYVVKVDAGLDGISTIQSLRENFKKTDAPIITCYPLLRQQLESKIPQDFFIQALALSGADIIYPGGSPTVGGGTRELGTEEKTAVSEATKRYRGFVEKGWPMVTLAGGIYAGQLQCLYELIGPNVAFFLGGAVALHKEGPIAGAELCTRVIKEAVKLHAQDITKIRNLPNSLIKEVEEAYEKPPGANEGTFSYVSPKDFLAQIPVQRW